MKEPSKSVGGVVRVRGVVRVGEAGRRGGAGLRGRGSDNSDGGGPAVSAPSARWTRMPRRGGPVVARGRAPVPGGACQGEARPPKSRPSAGGTIVTHRRRPGTPQHRYLRLKAVSPDASGGSRWSLRRRP